ncbi:MAG: pirin family protein [Myxococcota bacterium]
MMEIRRSADRGHANHGWLDSHHTFSFAGYYDPRFMGFSHLRVINHDRVEAGQGFGTHPHRNMEIVSYVVDGGLEHRDTLGTGSVIRPGDVQLMSAGSGIAHSEYNHSAEAPVEFLQIWVLPKESGGRPGYQQADFGRDPGLRLVVSPEGRDGSLAIKQDMDLWRVLAPTEPGWTASLAVKRARAWVQIVRGTLDVNGVRLYAGDGLAVTGDGAKPVLELVAPEGQVEALVFDLV